MIVILRGEEKLAREDEERSAWLSMKVKQERVVKALGVRGCAICQVSILLNAPHQIYCTKCATEVNQKRSAEKRRLDKKAAP